MLSWVVGNVDIPAAAVLIAAFTGIAVITNSFIVKYQSATNEEHEFELSKMRINKESQKELYQVEIEQNLITSHRAEN
jgi:hypothetical protein